MRTLVELFLAFLIFAVGLSQTPNNDNDVSFNLGNGLVDKASKILDKLGETVAKISIQHTIADPLPEPVRNTFTQIGEYYKNQKEDAVDTNKLKNAAIGIAIVLLCLLMLLIIVAMICCCVVTCIYSITQKRKYKKEQIPPPSTVVVSQPQPYQPCSPPPPPVAPPLSPDAAKPLPPQTSPPPPPSAQPLQPISPATEPKMEKLSKTPEINEEIHSKPPKEVAAPKYEKPPKTPEPLPKAETKDVGLQTEPKKEKVEKQPKYQDDQNQLPLAPPLPGFNVVDETPKAKDPEEKPKPREKRKTPKQVKGEIIDKGVQTDLDSSDDEKYREKIRGNEALPGRNKNGPRTELVV
uniref:Uncharacterized protein n=1 Tax=Panagrellus redivivus TaxID=6233 RepID=A0A7E4VYM2_PANRE